MYLTFWTQFQMSTFAKFYRREKFGKNVYICEVKELGQAK